jgi:hypothetical protein
MPPRDRFEYVCLSCARRLGPGILDETIEPSYPAFMGWDDLAPLAHLSLLSSTTRCDATARSSTRLDHAWDVKSQEPLPGISIDAQVGSIVAGAVSRTDTSSLDDSSGEDVPLSYGCGRT